MKKQVVSFELDDELSKGSQDKITEILREAKAENIRIDFEEESEDGDKDSEDSKKE